MKASTYQHTIYASYLGYITQAVVNNLAPLLFLIFQDAFSITLEKITLLITINFLVQLTVDLACAKWIDRLGYRRGIIAAHVFAGVGLVGLAVFPSLFANSYAGLLIAVVLYAIGGGLLEVLVSPIVEACPTDNKAQVMSLLHSFYCWGTVLVIVVSTAFLAIVGKGSWRVLPCVWALLPFGNALFFSRVPIAQLTEKGEEMSLKTLFGQFAFWLFMVLMVTAGASEQAMSQWASSFAEKGLGLSKTLGDLTGPCLFSILMGSARMIYAKFGDRMKLTSFLIGSGMLCIVSYLLAALSQNPVWALVGCASCGFSVGIMWPGVFSVASERFPKGGTAMFALLALSGDLGCSGGPTTVGFVSGLFGERLQAGLLAAIVFPVLLVGCSLIYTMLEKRRNVR